MVLINPYTTLTTDRLPGIESMYKKAIGGPPEETNWYVITGAPCSGKSAVIQMLAQRGFEVVHETARAFIDSQLACGYTLEKIKSDILSFERHILIEKVRIEKRLPRQQIHFLDRAVPDSVAYYQIEGLDGTEPLSYSRHVRYKGVFLFERLAFETDAVRTEDSELAERIELLLEKCYQQLGYTINRVPVMPIERRVEWVLQHSDFQ